jgi:anti-sigma regulatory factor (Ser/Thr protein kinase)
MTRGIVLGCLTIPGRPEHVSRARAFAGALAGHDNGDTAVLLTSELVTNAMLHTSSGLDGGTVTIVVIDGPKGLLIEVIDDGSPGGGPEVRGDRHAAQGHGLFLVQQLAAHWGYRQGDTGTTVWFRIDAGGTARHGGTAPESRCGGIALANARQRRRTGRAAGRDAIGSQVRHISSPPANES